MPVPTSSPDEDGYRLWLRYELISDSARLSEYRAAFETVVLAAAAPSATLLATERELSAGLSGLLGQRVRTTDAAAMSGGCVLLGAARDLPTPGGHSPLLAELGKEGFLIEQRTLAGARCLVITANEDIGVLYGVFHLLRQLQTEAKLASIALRSAPKLGLRMLNHWDNLDRTVERGYAGCSLWDWHKLPDYVSPQYLDYARACASIGINATVLTNVNANALVLSAAYLHKVAALAEVFRPFGIRVFLTARFSAPIELGALGTADPLNEGVIRFWRDKAAEIYKIIPNFGGFLVKANSEGQPGPQDYQRTHAEGANLLADALAPHGGLVVWRAFVYAAEPDTDRAMQAYDELTPLDGKFRSNVIVQVKNGPIDFQPREPFHPLFGALRQTRAVAEFQLTQEYLGCATHLAYLGPLIEEVLRSDTEVDGPGSTVARVLQKSENISAPSGMAAVANIGNERNWCGHPFAQANWFAFGRFSWDPELSAAAIADEWIRMTFGNDPHCVAAVRAMMLGSREAVVNYMTPLGLHHLMAWDHHYGPGPWINQGRADWTSVYFHRADSAGLGFDRSPSGSNAASQYAKPVAERFGQLETCPENLLLFFHHVAWSARLSSGRTLWEELCARYSSGVAFVAEMRATWAALSGQIDSARHLHVSELLKIQEREAKWWRDACLLYFQTFSNEPIPAEYERPSGTLAEYERVRHWYVPGIKERG
jgi:alpha-glucuronidase